MKTLHERWVIFGLLVEGMWMLEEHKTSSQEAWVAE